MYNQLFPPAQRVVYYFDLLHAAQQIKSKW